MSFMQLVTGTGAQSQQWLYNGFIVSFLHKNSFALCINYLKSNIFPSKSDGKTKILTQLMEILNGLMLNSKF